MGCKGDVAFDAHDVAQTIPQDSVGVTCGIEERIMHESALTVQQCSVHHILRSVLQQLGIVCNDPLQATRSISAVL